MSEEETSLMAVPQGAVAESASEFENRLEQFNRLAQGVIRAGLAPKGMSRPEQVIIAMQTGHELGLPPMRSLSCVTVVNGRAGLMGDAAMGLLNARGALKPGTGLETRYVGEGDELRCEVTLWRKGADEPVTGSFSVADAKKAKLWGKGGPWSDYPKRMLMWRALGFLLRDHFSDYTMGLPLTEEVRDIPSGAHSGFERQPEQQGPDPLLESAMAAHEAAQNPPQEVEDAEIVEPEPEPAEVASEGDVEPPAIEDALGAQDAETHGYPSSSPEGGEWRKLVCKCGHPTLVKPGTPSPISCERPQCDRQFRVVSRGKNKGDVVNERNPDWEPPATEPELDGDDQGQML